MDDNERRRATPPAGALLDLELGLAADLSLALNSVARDLGRVVGSLGHLAPEDRKAELQRIGSEFGQLGDLLHEARHVFWDAAGGPPLGPQNGVVRLQPPRGTPPLTESGEHDSQG
jgi:hypothetical protein